MISNQYYSNKLDLDEFFWAAQDYNYVIIKIEHFPNYYKGSDIDIFTDNPFGLARLILRIGNRYLKEKNYEIRVSGAKKNTHTYVDFYFNQGLDLRFDIYLRPLKFKKITLKKDLFSDAIRNRTFFNSVYLVKEYPVYIPSKMDDLLLRYIEYLEWYKKRHDKIKHLDYVLEKISSDKEKRVFLDKVRDYTKFHGKAKLKKIL